MNGLVDEEGAVVDETYLTPFGEVALESEQVRNNFRFLGQYHDRESRLYYNWNRYYIPSVGRYDQVDPIKSQQVISSAHLFKNTKVLERAYSYSLNNPLLYLDLVGLETCCKSGVIDCPGGYWSGITGGLTIQISNQVPIGFQDSYGYLECASNRKKISIHVRCMSVGAVIPTSKWLYPVAATLDFCGIHCKNAKCLEHLSGESKGVAGGGGLIVGGAAMGLDFGKAVCTSFSLSAGVGTYIQARKCFLDYIE